MADSPAERLCRLNGQAIALLRLGIPLDLGLASVDDADATIKRLNEINDALKNSSGSAMADSALADSAQVGNSQSVDHLLSSPSIPDTYRELASLLLASRDPASILKSLSIGQPDFDQANRSIRNAFLQPAVILVLVWLGVIFLCVHVLPIIESAYKQNFSNPSGATAWLLAFKEWLPVWIIAVPILGILGWLYLPQRAGRLWFRLMPGTQKYTHWIKSASDAARLSATVNSTSGETNLLQSDPSVANNPIIHRIVTSSDREERPSSLDKLSRFYQTLATTRYRQFFGQFAGYLGLFIAGIAALAYGLATFLPWVEILMSLSDEVRPR